MISFPNCKINLGLNILKKRDDGYHEVVSIMYPVPIHDVLEILPLPSTQTPKITLSGNKIEGSIESNLCWKAYLLLKNKHNLPPVHIHLHKLIPMGGGLGGGSANGTYTLTLLNKLLELKLSEEQLKGYASELGSDCSFFVANKPQVAKGRGELVTPIDIDLKGHYLVLLNDGTHVSTQMAYSSIKPNYPNKPIEEIIMQPINSWKNHLINDFEAPIFNKFPNLAKLKDLLYKSGAVYAAMTGSGATVFGIFKEKPNLPLLEMQGFVRSIQL